MSTFQVATASGLHSFGEARSVEFNGQNVTALHTKETGERWALIDQNEVWRDSGADWQLVAPSEKHRLDCVLAHGENVWVGASDGRLLRVEEPDLIPWESFDEAPGRDDWFTPWGGPPDVRSLAASNQHVYANVHVGGILRGDLGGSRWEPTIEIGADVHEVITDSQDGVFAATAKGLAQSWNRGETWEFIDQGLHAPYSRAIAVSEGILFMTASEGPFGGRAAIYRRSQKDEAFTKCENGLPEWFEGNIDTGCLAASGTSVAFGTEDGRVFLSSDHGNSWNEVASDLAAVTWVEPVPD